jgi:hypothetical protein
VHQLAECVADLVVDHTRSPWLGVAPVRLVAAWFKTWPSTRSRWSCTGWPPEQFTAARNAAAKAAKDGGDASRGEAIKTLRKPTLAAWLANQLVRADPDGVNDLTQLGEQLRQAHVSGDAQLRRLRHGAIAWFSESCRPLATWPKSTDAR